MIGVLATAWLASATGPLRAGEEPRPVERRDQSWRIRSFGADAGLARVNVFHLDFQRDGTTWIATSDGLYRYDGYQWRRFSVEDGLPSAVIRTVLVTRRGVLWVGTDHGAGVFDGHVFRRMGSERGLAGPCVRSIVEDPDGTLWFCCDQWPDARVPGGLSSYHDGVWKTYRERDGLSGDCVLDYFRDSRGRQFAMISGKGVDCKVGDRWRPWSVRGCAPWSMAETAAAGLVTHDFRKVVVIRGTVTNEFAGADTQAGLGNGAPSPLCATRDGALLTGSFLASGNRFGFFEWTGAAWRLVSAVINVRRTMVNYVREAPDGAIWCAGLGFLLRWERRGGEWTEFTNLASPQLRDRQGRVWFADARAAVRLEHGRFESEPAFRSPLVLDGQGNVWSVNDDAVRLLRAGGGGAAFTRKDIGLRTIGGDALDGRGRFCLFGEDAQGNPALAMFGGSRWTPHAILHSQDWRITGACAEPRHGGLWLLLRSSDTAGPLRLVRVGEGVSETLAFDFWRYGDVGLLADRQGAVWVYGYTGLYRHDALAGRDWRHVEAIPGNLVLAGLLRNDEAWFTYEGVSGGQDGLALYRQGRWRFFSSESEASSTLATLAPDGTLYFGSALGLRVVGPTERAPRELIVPGGGEVLSVVPDATNGLWLGVRDPLTDLESVYRYRPDGIPPQAEIVATDKEVRENGFLKVRLAAIERFVPRAAQEADRFSWRLDRGAWSGFAPAPANGIPVAGLAAGRHTLRVRAQDEGLDVSQAPAELAFTVLPVPLQERSWFRPLVSGVFLLLLALAVLSLDRTLRFARANTRLKEQIAVRRQAEEELKETHGALQRAHAELGQTNEQLEQRVLERTRQLQAETSGRLQAEARVAAVAAERNRLARELHDSLEQGLTGVALQLEAAAKAFERNPEKARGRMNLARELVRHSQDEVRRSVWDLRSRALENQLLPTALEYVSRQLTEAAGVEAEVVVQGAPRRLPEEVENHLLRIGQEALTNAIRHGGARRAVVELEFQAEVIRLKVCDDGCGFASQRQTEPEGGHFGLRGMAERVQRLGGQFSVESAPGRGTIIAVAIPLSSMAES